jgi:hypothetical protein
MKLGVPMMLDCTEQQGQVLPKAYRTLHPRTS